MTRADLERLMPAREAAKLAGVRPATISKWIKSGLLIAVPVGSTKFIRLNHLQQVMRDRAESPSGKLPPNTLDRK